MGTSNKKHNQKINRTCPICGGKVLVGNSGNVWWVYCSNDVYHIPQQFYPYPYDAIRAWNRNAVPLWVTKKDANLILDALDMAALRMGYARQNSDDAERVRHYIQREADFNSVAFWIRHQLSDRMVWEDNSVDSEA